MRRREFITFVGGAAATWPVSAQAQQAATPVVGFLTPGSAVAWRPMIAGFREGLKGSGYVEGQNVAIEYRFAEGQFDRLPALAVELVQRPVNVLVVSSLNGALAAKQATSRIPVVFTVGGDPIEAGIVTQLARPDGNITGTYQFSTALEAKRLGLLHDMVPKAATIGVLINPGYSNAEKQLQELRDASTRLGVELVITRANVEHEIDEAFATLDKSRVGGLLVCASPFLFRWRERLIPLTIRHGVPAIFENRDFATGGGLMSYGTSLADAYRQAGIYAGKILKGAQPADLPVVQSTRFEFVINLNTAKALGIDVPPALSSIADEVIE
jgi:putative ABC transport system substrate-binding protein